LAIRWYHFLVAIISFAAIIKFVWITPTPDYYFQLPIFIWFTVIPFIIIHVAYLYFAVFKKIPAPEVVTASLSARRLTSYVPMWDVYPGILAFIIIIAYYGWASYGGHIDAEVARMNVYTSIFTVGWWAAATYFIIRKKI
jgi:hypothetical protein